jgi:pyruvate dehydrogenase (quinone)
MRHGRCSRLGRQEVLRDIGDAINPMIDALHHGGKVEFILVRDEEVGTLAAVAESLVTGDPVAVCGTAGPGVTHLLNGLLDASRERVPVIAVAGDNPSDVIDTGTIEEINPYDLFKTASLYTGRIHNPAQTRAVVQTAAPTAIVERGPTVIAVPGDVAAKRFEDDIQKVTFRQPLLRPVDMDLRELADLSIAPKTSRSSGATVAASRTTRSLRWLRRLAPRSATRTGASSGLSGRTPTPSA